LFSRSGETENIDWTVSNLINSGIPKEKLVLGLAAYGHGFKLTDQNRNTPGSLTENSQKQMYIYPDVCRKLAEGGWQRAWSEEQRVPYAFKHNEWISYDDAESMKIKVFHKFF
jgi:chitinase